MTGGNYSDVSTVLAGSKIYASILKTAVEALDQTIFDKIGGGSGSVTIKAGTINGATLGATTPAAATATVLTAKPAAAILASDVQGVVLAASYSATGKAHAIDWSPNNLGSHPLRIAGMFNADGVGMDLVFYTNTYTLSGVERLRIDAYGKVTMTGAFQHTGSTFGAFNTTPASRPSAYTQTYATATRTHSNLTAAALTNAHGTGDTTIADVGASFSQTTLNNNFRDLSNQVNALLTDLTNLKQVVNSVIDDQQTLGFFQ